MIDIVIASGKGGTGKTTLSVNLSHYLGENGKKIALGDLDVEEPNSSLFVDLELLEEKISYKMVPRWMSENCTLCGECASNCNFNAIVALPSEILVCKELCHSCYACSELCPTDSLPMTEEKIGTIKYYKNSNFDFVEGRLDIGQEMAVPLISQTIRFVKENFKNSIRIYDAPPGTSCPVIEATKESDFVLLVTEPTPFGLNDLILAVETMRVIKKRFAVVINRYGIGDNRVEEYCKNEGIDIAAKFLNDKEVAKLYAKGKLLYKYIDHFKISLSELLKYLRNETGVEL